METCIAESCTTAAAGSPSLLVFSHLLRTLLLKQCTLADNSIYPPDRTDDVLMNPEFDFIVVGGGTAGSVVASRLSENNNWKVLLIERGKDPSLLTYVPGIVLHLQGTDEDYSYETEPNSGYCQGSRIKRCIWAKGKGLGGSSIINAMLHIHGNDRDYNKWAAMGNKGWSYEEVLPYFRKSENYHPDIIKKYGSKNFGTGGPLYLQYFNYSDSPMADILINAAEDKGIPRMEVFNGDKYIGFGLTHGNIKNGRRMNVAEAFLSPAKNRNNLFVMKSTRADSIIMEGKEAKGVRVTLQNGRKIELKASKEVILSAGSIASPQILMLSGIGPKKHLEEVGVEPLVDLPVGEILWDHISMFSVHLTYYNESRLNAVPTDLLDVTYNYLIHNKGPLTTNGGIDLVGYVNVDDPTSLYPNIEYHFAYIPRGHAFMMDSIANSFGMNNDIKAEMMKLNQEYDDFIVGPVLLNPKSAGKLKLRSKNPEDQIKIYPNYLEHEDDLTQMVNSIKFLKDMEETKTFKKYGIKMKSIYIEDCKDFELGTEEYWRCNLRQTATTVYHPVGSAKMGPVKDPQAVVDSRLRVHGVKRLRVIDASIMPYIPSGNTNSPTMMIAEKGADMIKQDWLKKKDEF